VYGEDMINVSSDTGSIVLRMVKRTLVTGTAALQQRVLCDLQTVSHAEVEKCVDNEGGFVEK
jgi:hypothetical protein